MSEETKKVSPTSIMEKKEYVDERGRIIQHFTAVMGWEPPKEYSPFMGIASVPIPTPFGEDTKEIPFPIEATTLKEAFENMDECGRKFFDEMRKQMRDDAPRIQVPR